MAGERLKRCSRDGHSAVLEKVDEGPEG